VTDISLAVGLISDNRDVISVPPCDCDISNAWMITPVQSFVVVLHVPAQSGSYSDLTVLAATPAMGSATIITTLTLLCSTNQQTLFAHSKSSKRMLKKFSKTNIKNLFILGIHCVDFVSSVREVFKEVKIFFKFFWYYKTS